MSFIEKNDFFPEGEDAWGNSDIEPIKLSKKERKEMAKKIESDYKEYLNTKQSDRPFNLGFIARVIKEKRIR